MKDVLTYKDFIGSVHFSADDKVFHGKIEGITDLVTFEGERTDELEKAFHEAVDDYIALCKEAGKEPLKSCKGSFNVRIPSELHVKAAKRATMLGITLNQFVYKAIESVIESPLPIRSTLARFSTISPSAVFHKSSTPKVKNKKYTKGKNPLYT
jgi:predicted HicB family RNase H-like nuclease